MKLDPFLQELLPGFAVEAREICERVQQELVELERDLGEGQRRAVYESMARGLHTLKGTAATLGLEELADLAHQMENQIAPRRSSLERLPGDLADSLLRGVDLFLLHARSYAAGQLEGLPALPSFDGPAEGAVVAGAGALAAEGPASLELDASGWPLPRSGLSDEDRSVTSRRGAPAQPGAGSSSVREPLPMPAAGIRSGPSAGSGPDESAPIHEVEFEGSWRVNTAQVMSLMREVERLREVRLRLDERRRDLETALIGLQRLGQRRETAEVRGMMGAVVRSLAEDGGETEELVASLEEGLKAISTLPLRTVIDPLQRTVRDLARRSGKEARLAVVGAEVSLDRRLLESLKGPLVHLVRNAVDHGVESPASRQARGKHREGAIVIRVEQRGNLVSIEVEDDGNGLDDQRIREEAARQGLRTAAELKGLSVQDLHQLIFAPGFSTQREVTTTSGRGVGLDVVRRQVAALNGNLEVFSRPGQGTRFALSVAAELGSSPVLMVRCSEQVFGLPLLSIESLLTTQQGMLRVGRNKIQLEHLDQLLQVVDLGVLLGLRPPGPVEEGKPIVVIKSVGRQLALAVDEVFGDRDLVIRPLPAELRDLVAYQGAAILAQGQMMLVVRSEWLTNPDRLITQVLAVGNRALVVDDSLTARALHRAALESGGYLVHTASSGQQALEQLSSGSYDVIICDVLMAGMDGLQFTQKVRTRSDTRQVPLVLVSARDSETDRRRGLAAGADAFISKKECASGRLLSEVSSVIARRARSA